MSDGIRSNVIIGRGLYYSDDAGETWERRGLEEMGQLGAVDGDDAAVMSGGIGPPGDDVGRRQHREAVAVMRARVAAIDLDQGCDIA